MPKALGKPCKRVDGGGVGRYTEHWRGKGSQSQGKEGGLQVPYLCWVLKNSSLLLLPVTTWSAHPSSSSTSGCAVFMHVAAVATCKSNVMGLLLLLGHGLCKSRGAVLVPL